MSNFVKAKLQRISPDENETPVGAAIEVQFNPSSLRMTLANQTDTGNSAGRQRAQYLGTGSATLSLELVFDTADEGTTDAPRSVLDKTTPIEQLLLPQGSTQEKQSPAKVRFQWGQFVVSGVIENMGLDLELFSEGGVPLRAKMTLSIRQQRTDFEFLRAGPGANAPGNAVSPGQAGLGAVGGVGLGLSLGLSAGIGIGASAGISLGGGISLGAGVSLSAGVRTTAALGGESAAQLAARVGIDPAAWRAVAVGQESTGGSSLALPAGASVDFPIGVSAGASLGARTGVEARAAGSLDESFGLAAPAASGGAATSAGAAGFTLSAAGGVQAALGAVDTVRSESAAADARRAFGAASPALAAGGGAAGLATLPSATAAASTAGALGPPAPPRPERPEQPRRPLFLSGFPSRGQQEASLPVPPPPRPDPRAVSFGLGVPLRPRLGGATDDRRAALGGAVRLRAAQALPAAADPTRPSWEAPMTAASPAPAGAPAAAAHRGARGGCSCGCSGGK